MNIQAVRGMPDVLPADAARWGYVEHQVRRLFASYGLVQIRTPIVEDTGLFARSIGDVTDIVEKEMYSFEDRSGESLTLRPELTAGWYARRLSMAYCTIKPSDCGTKALRFGMNVRKKDATASFIKLAWSALGSPMR